MCIHQPVGPRRKRIPDGYGDVARLYEEAWSFDLNDALCNMHLQDKLVLLLMLDTAALIPNHGRGSKTDTVQWKGYANTLLQL